MEANVATAQTLISYDPDTRLEVRCDVTRYSDSPRLNGCFI
jgi:hypothetical protein